MSTETNVIKAHSALTALSIMARESANETPWGNVTKFSYDLMTACYEQSADAGWWTNLKTGERLDGELGVKREHPANVPAKLMLMVTELAEMFLGWQSASVDDHLPERRSIEVELADTVIRIADTAGGTFTSFSTAMAVAWGEEFVIGDSGAANMMYVVTELAAAMEGYRKGTYDQKQIAHTLFEMSLARAMIRCVGIANIYGLDLAGAVRDKLAYNSKRPDHKQAHRVAEGGKSV